MLKLIDPIYTKLGFNARPEDTHLDIKLRKKAVSFHTFNISEVFFYKPQISWACSMGNKDCLNKAKENFAEWMGMVEPDSETANP